MLTSAILCNQKNFWLYFWKEDRLKIIPAKFRCIWINYKKIIKGVESTPPPPTYTCSKKPNRCRVKMMFSFVIISSIAATTLTTKSEQWNSIFKSKKANFAFSLENELDITVWESIFHYAINSCVYLKRQFTEVC